MVKKAAKHLITAGFLRIPPSIPVNMLKHEFTQPVHRFLDQGAHGQMRGTFAGLNHIGNHGIDPFSVGFAQNMQTVRGKLKGFQNAGAKRIVQIMVQISDPVRPAHTFRLRSFRLQRTGMPENSAADFSRQIQAVTSVFQTIHHPETLLIVAEPFRQEIVEGSLADMTERRMAQIVPQSDGFRQILVQAQSAGDGAGDLGNLQRMRQPGAVMISLGRKKNLRFKFQAAEGFAMNNPVPVPLKIRPDLAGGYGTFPPGALRRMGCIGSQQHIFLPLGSFTDRHAGFRLPSPFATPS